MLFGWSWHFDFNAICVSLVFHQSHLTIVNWAKHFHASTYWISTFYFDLISFLILLYVWVVLDGKTFKKPRRPYEKERLDAELKLVGEYGLRCKRELWRVQYALSRIRNNARMLLTLDEKNPRRIFEGEALLRRMNRYGLLEENQNKLDYVLALTVESFLERRLQTLVFKTGMAKSIHHARVLIRQRHIRYYFYSC